MVTMVALVASLLSISSAQDGLNVYVVMDAGNTVAEDAIGSAMTYLEKNKGAKVAKKSMIEVEGSEAYVTVEKVCGELDSMLDGGTPPDLVLDLTKIGISSEVVKSLSLTLGLPTVSAALGEEGDIREWRELTDAQKQYLIQVRPPGDLLPKIIRDLALASNITNAGILYDKTFVMDHQYKSLLLNMPVRHIINKVKTSSSEIKKQLTRLEEMDIKNYFILGNSDTLMNVYKAASELKMYGEKYAWFAGTKESGAEFDASCCDEMAVAFFSPILPSSAQIRSYKTMYGLTATPEIDAGFYFDLTVRSLTAVHNMKSGGSWPEMTYTKCSEYTSDVPIDRSLDLVSSIKSVSMPDAYGSMMLVSNGLSYMSFDLGVVTYDIMSGKIANREDIGTWTSGTPEGTMKFNAGMEETIVKFRAKTVYRVVSVIQPPFMFWNETTKKYEGYCADLIEELTKIMDFEYEVYIAPDGKYGRMDENEEWDGLIAELVNKKADMAVGALSVMAERENVVDFTVPYYDLVGITIMMKKPKVPTSLFKFLSVLEDSVWGCILAAYFVTSVLMWIFDRWSPYSYQNNMEKYEDDDEKRYFNFKESLWFCMTSLTPQGGGEAPKNLSGRLVAATWWLFGFIIIASYTANLAAFLTVSRLETPVESLEDLAKQYKIQYAPQNGSATAMYFERMAYIEERFYTIWKEMSLNDSLSELERSRLAVWDYPVSDKYTKIWQSMKEANLPATFEEALKRVRESPSSSEGFAFLGDATDIRYQTYTNCDLQMVGDEFSRKPYALAVQQGSPLKDQFNDAILKLLNQRKLETLKERWWNQNPQKKVCEEDDNDGGGISIHNIGGVFIVIFVGIGLAIITLGIEYWYYKYKAPQSRVGSADPNRKMVSEFEKQVRDKNGFGKTEFAGEYMNNEGSSPAVVAPVGNPW